MKRQTEDGNSSTVALYNGLELVRLLSEEGPMSAEELAKRLSLRNETTVKLLKTLEMHGFIERSRFAERFQPGRVAGTLAEKFLSDSPVHEVSRPVLQGLADRHNATTGLAIAHERKTLFLLTCNGLNQSTPPSCHAGCTYTLSQTAAGHVLLLSTARADMPDAQSLSDNDPAELQTLEHSFLFFRTHGCFRLALPEKGLLMLGAPLHLNNTVMAVEIVLPLASETENVIKDLLASTQLIQHKCADAGLLYLEDS